MKLLNTTLWSGAIVAIYGVLEHLGIDKNIWQQDVQHRVFSTLGQPNWLAAWLVALIPITWSQILENSNTKISFKKIVPHAFSLLYFTVLLFTGSRSGLLGMGVVTSVYWLVIFLKYKLKYVKQFISINLIIGVIALIFGTQLTPSIFKLIEKSQATQPSTSDTQTGSTALETGGTESGAIRKIVWQGAIQVWEHYPVFGTGLETFAYSYYLYRPAAHNLTSEWDFIYNKAHNEYLNFMANTGTVGILAYLTMIGFSLYLLVRTFFHKGIDESSLLLPTALIAGYVSILVTNFFGFSVVPIQIQFYLYPAFSIMLLSSEIPEKEGRLNTASGQKALNWTIVLAGAFLVFITCRYWYADLQYSAGVNYNRIGRFDISPQYLTEAIKLEPDQSVYYAELAKAYTNLAVAYSQAKEATVSSQLTEAAINNSIKAVDLAPANVNLKRMEFGVFVTLSAIDSNYLVDAKDVLVAALAQAPTDAKLYYNLGLIYSRIGQNDLALQTLKTTVDLRPNYGDARLAYGILLTDAKRYDEAKVQLEYFLKNIDPGNAMAKQYLESIK